MEIYPRVTDIPLYDVNLTLEKYGIFNSKNSYESLKNLIFSGKLKDASNSVVNWILAYNANNANNAKQNNIGVYNISQIIRTSDNELFQLSKQLGLQYPNKDNIMQILGYLNKLKDDFALLPDEILIKIMTNLDYDDLELLSTTSKRIENLYYSTIFAPILKEKLRKILDYRFSGIKSIGTNELILRDRMGNDEEDGIIYSDINKCMSYDIDILINIMWRLGVKINYVYINDKNILWKLFNEILEDGDDFFNAFHTGLFEKWSLDKLNFYYHLYANPPIKTKACEMIEDRLKELELLRYK